jgi:hypothetical protein
VRRVIIFLVLAVLGASWYGLAASPTALAVSGTSVSPTEFQAELTAFNAHPGLFCFFSSLINAAITKPGAGRDSLSLVSEVQWLNLRVEGIAIDRYVATTLHHVPSAVELTSAQSALEGELTQAAARASANCPGTSTQALAEMPAAMRTAQIEDQASSAYLLGKLDSTIALTPTNIKAYYQSHKSTYENLLCVAVAIVPQSSLAAFAKSQSQGKSVSTLAKTYSADPTTASKGGFFGCIEPQSSSYASVHRDIGTAAVGHFPTTALSYTPNQGGPTYGLFVADIYKAPISFAKAEGAVISDIQTSNAAAANAIKSNILNGDPVTIDPAFGRWALSSNGFSALVPALPAETGPATSTQLTTASTTPYQ